LAQFPTCVIARSTSIAALVPAPIHTAPRSTWRSVVVTWEVPGEPIVLTSYGPDGEVAVPLTPTRALALAVELTQRAVVTIKVNQWGPGWPG
jgi:hypothetical protein